MKMDTLHILLSTICIMQSMAQDLNDDWIIQIFDPPQNVIFNCSSPNQTPPNGSEPVRWMFPNLTNVDLDYSDGRIAVTNGGHNLQIINADIDDFGIYHCMMLYPVNETEEWYLIKVGLNVKGPYFEDLWEKYKTGTIIGISACLGFLATAVIIWFVAVHKWVAPPGWSEEGDDDEGVENNAFDANTESSNDLNISYIPSPDSTDTSLHHRNQNQPNNEPQIANGDVRASGYDMVTEL